MTEIINPTTDNTFKKYIPLVTVIGCLISIALFLGIRLEGNEDSWDTYKKWGAPPAHDIFNGSYWGLFTSNFLHFEIWHIAFNLYWFWIFGKAIEFKSNKFFYMLLILSAALVSSLAQIAFSDSTGIGLSGIAYAQFGYLFVKSRTTKEYKGVLDKRTVSLFFIWLVLCIFLTKTGILTVGNAAHIGGLCWGILVAYVAKYGKLAQLATGFCFVAVLMALTFYGPYSVTYLTYKALDLHKNQQVSEAIKTYRKILKVDPDNQFAKTNLQSLELQEMEVKAYELHKNEKVNEAIEAYREILKKYPDSHLAKQNLQQLEVYQLEERAYELQKKGQYSEARQLYNQILSVDQHNAWAKENLAKLPQE